jgi:Flp pilus assembly protein TadB
MTQYRLDKASDTWLKYDEKTDVWRATAEGATALQRRPHVEIEPLRDNPVIMVAAQHLEPTEQPQSAQGAQGKQTDTAETIARGVLIESLPLLGLSLLLAILIMFLVWYTGVVNVGLLGYFVGVLGIAGLVGTFCYNMVAKRAHEHSYYGAENRKTDATERVAHHQIDSREHVVLTAMEQHHAREMKRLGVNDEQ